jgi:hypothetical protein
MKLVLFFLLCAPSFAAYRIYKLRVLHYNEKGKLSRTENVLTTLDHLQYEHYHSMGKSKVVYEDSWYCPGDTSRKKPCDKPLEKPPRGPASLDHPKRVPMPRNRQPVIP